MQKELKVRNESIDTAGIKKDYKDAIAEYIWNGFDAKANVVNIHYETNALGNISEIKIVDDGEGINFENIEDTFGSFLSSQKVFEKRDISNIQGSKGKGRFSFVGFAHSCDWNTVYNNNGQNFKFTISIKDGFKDKYDIGNKEITTEKTGTGVTIYGINSLAENSLKNNDFENYLLSCFAWYLYLNKTKKIFIQGEELSYNEIINEEISKNDTPEIDGYNFQVYFINWKLGTKCKYYTYVMDVNNNFKGKYYTSYNNNSIDFIHSVYVKSEYFNDFIKISEEEVDNQITLENTKNDKDKTFKTLQSKVKDLIEERYKLFLRKNSEKIIENLDEEKVFPAFSDDVYGKLRKEELTSAIKGIYCLEPRIFQKINIEQKKTFVGFLDLLLVSNERDNIIKILDSIINLSEQERANLARLLSKTTLNNIVTTINLLDNRKDVIENLKKIIFRAGDYVNERDHIQKIMEKNYWIFGEQYHLITADKNFEKALIEYAYFLDDSQDKKEDYKIENQDKLKRMDIFLAGKKPLESYGNSSILEENIILELKRPLVPIDKDIFRQIEDYMEFIIKEVQFNSSARKWSFYAISSKVDEYIERKYKENKEKGVPFLVKAVENYTIYVMTWDDVFRNFEAKYRYLYDRLKFQQQKIEEESINKEYVSKIVEEIREKDVI